MEFQDLFTKKHRFSDFPYDPTAAIISRLGTLSTSKLIQLPSSNMEFFKRTCGSGLLALGALFILAAFMGLVDTTSTIDNRAGVFGVGSVLGILLLWIGGQLWRKPKQKTDAAEAKSTEEIGHISAPLKTEEEIRTAFFTLVEKSNGCVTLFKFAMETNLPGEDARNFLDAQAKAFGASFIVNDRGDVVYRFPL